MLVVARPDGEGESPPTTVYILHDVCMNIKKNRSTGYARRGCEVGILHFSARVLRCQQRSW